MGSDRRTSRLLDQVAGIAPSDDEWRQRHLQQAATDPEPASVPAPREDDDPDEGES